MLDLSVVSFLLVTHNLMAARCGDMLWVLHVDSMVVTATGGDAEPVVTYAHYACVADCADAMADAWEDTAGCAQPICLHKVIVYRYVGIARDRAHMNVDCVQSMHMSVDIISVHHSVTTHSW